MLPIRPASERDDAFQCFPATRDGSSAVRRDAPTSGDGTGTPTAHKRSTDHSITHAVGTLSTSGLKSLLQVVECGDAIGRCSARAPRRRIPMHCVQANKAAIAIGTANLASHNEYPLETAARSVSACFCRTELIDSGSGSTRMPNSHLWHAPVHAQS